MRTQRKMLSSDTTVPLGEAAVHISQPYPNWTGKAALDVWLRAYAEKAENQLVANISWITFKSGFYSVVPSDTGTSSIWFKQPSGPNQENAKEEKWELCPLEPTQSDQS